MEEEYGNGVLVRVFLFIGYIKREVMEEKKKSVVVVADGDFPEHRLPLQLLSAADVIVCCDGSASKLVGAGFIPNAIVGDMDSLDEGMKLRFSSCIYQDKDQETNDLTKAVKWCQGAGYGELAILGATGMREDHTIGNISLLTEYAKFMKVRMVTDHGIIIPLTGDCEIGTVPGQQVSLFSIGQNIKITSRGLKYPLVKRTLKNWWEATLNEAEGTSINLTIEDGPVLVYLNHQE